MRQVAVGQDSAIVIITQVMCLLALFFLDAKSFQMEATNVHFSTFFVTFPLESIILANLDPIETRSHFFISKLYKSPRIVSQFFNPFQNFSFTPELSEWIYQFFWWTFPAFIHYYVTKNPCIKRFPFTSHAFSRFWPSGHLVPLFVKENSVNLRLKTKIQKM